MIHMMFELHFTFQIWSDWMQVSVLRSANCCWKGLSRVAGMAEVSIDQTDQNEGLT